MESQAIIDPGVVPPESYRGNMVGKYHPTPDEKKIIDQTRQQLNRLDYSNYDLQSLWYQISLFKHGIQNMAFSHALGRPYPFEEFDDEEAVTVIYNILQSIQTTTSAYFLDSPPRYNVRAITEDFEDIEKSKLGDQILRHFQTTVNVSTVRQSATNWLTTIGNAVIFCGWDPMAGKVINFQGTSIPTGSWSAEAVPPYQIIIDPNAIEPRGPNGPKWAGRKRIVSRDLVATKFRKMVAYVADEDSYALDPMGTYELQFRNLSQRHGFGYATDQANASEPEGRRSVLLLEKYELPSPWHPKGRYIAMTGDNVLLHAGPNPYGHMLPFCFCPMIQVEGSFWGRSTLFDLIYIQLEINRRERQKSEYCNLLGHPIFYHYEGDGIDAERITNIMGQILELNPMNAHAPPSFVRPPDMSPTVKEMVPEAMRFADFISGNFGPARGEVSSRVSSGVQQMMLEEADARNMKPMMANWEAMWEDFHKLAIMNFQKFAKLPQQMKVVGASGQHRLSYVQGSDLTDTTDVEVVPGSSTPKSESAVFTKMLTLLQAGAINIMDPYDSQKFWEALNMGDMVRIKADQKADLDKALRNIQRIKNGEPPMYDSVTDDANVHIAAIGAYQKSAEYEYAGEQVKFLAHLYKQMVMAPLMEHLRSPTVPSGFPMFDGPEGSKPAPQGPQGQPGQQPQSQEGVM